MNNHPLCIFLFSLILASLFFVGCGHHKRHYRYVNVATINSQTTPVAPNNVTIIVQQPPAYDQDALLNELLAELRTLGPITVNLTIVVENNITVENSVEVDGSRIVIYPGWQRRIPRLYHWYRKWLGENCERVECSEDPKPCDNESP